ncbi:MAG: iron-sulfur cluster assembly accessory protein [Chloroflexi bacterium]|nr:iron-sulfur cluster assembly accessory protein [Chloroflexota bacterium]
MINVSDRAVAEMKHFLSEGDDPEAAIHVFVAGACGCGSTHYGMAVGNEIPEAAHIFDIEGVRLVVDTESAPHLDGAEIDFRDDLMGRGFVIKNPNKASTGCGCGG